MNTELSLRLIDTALNTDFYEQPEMLKVIEAATAAGYIKRLSHTQAQWTVQGLAKARVELPNDLPTEEEIADAKDNTKARVAFNVYNSGPQLLVPKIGNAALLFMEWLAMPENKGQLVSLTDAKKDECLVIYLKGIRTTYVRAACYINANL